LHRTGYAAAGVLRTGFRPLCEHPDIRRFPHRAWLCRPRAGVTTMWRMHFACRAETHLGAAPPYPSVFCGAKTEILVKKIALGYLPCVTVSPRGVWWGNDERL